MNFLDERIHPNVWASLSPCPMTGCWLWTKAEHRGRFKVYIDGKQKSAHQMLWLANGGGNTDAGRRLERTCGVDSCCNPSHLKIGLRSYTVDRNLVGSAYGYLTVLAKSPSLRKTDGTWRKMWLCECVCGTRKPVREHSLLDGEARSCGCKRYDLLVKDHAGKRFGKLTALHLTGKTTQRGAMWLVRCDCGVEKVMDAARVQRTASCGCSINVTHGYSRRGNKARSTYRIWSNMKGRCSNPNTSHYADYGGRGIRVCERWNTFENFLADMGERPGKMWLDRIDPNGDYEPNNCRWLSPVEQMRNKRLSSERVGVVLDRYETEAPALIAAIRKELFGV